MAKKVFKGKLDFAKYEDGGQALLADFNESNDNESGMFVIVQSWAEGVTNKQLSNHPDLAQFINKKVQITIETI